MLKTYPVPGGRSHDALDCVLMLQPESTCASVALVTLTTHFMTSAVSSDATSSTHLRLGSLSLRICFLTIASKARSGVKSPVLKGHGVRCMLLWRCREKQG
ncbi:hypothetical protein EYF80_019391 [Liparis tanakae]|uniref:Uncharacterized protein n=1 Tax=Liparis tanakae TaxID=230148 RepID=A0A4Z2HYH1_9TELE|nr:hypothetical protein EYF80_019391 [Liparis tanakae]